MSTRSVEVGLIEIDILPIVVGLVETCILPVEISIVGTVIMIVIAIDLLVINIAVKIPLREILNLSDNYHLETKKVATGCYQCGSGTHLIKCCKCQEFGHMSSRCMKAMSKPSHSEPSFKPEAH